ncbi:MAG: hypothetical protein PHC88_04500 [Terrimicrobiaceae bacterium]|nr:hypothetical protein [Terrimicrobiaceae bacterium]
MKDDLSDLLKTWQPQTPEPVAFRRDVWTRIEMASPPADWWQEVLVLVARPRVALAVAVVAIALGGISGRALSGVPGTDAYLRSVNPYAMIR